MTDASYEPEPTKRLWTLMPQSSLLDSSATNHPHSATVPNGLLCDLLQSVSDFLCDTITALCPTLCTLMKRYIFVKMATKN